MTHPSKRELETQLDDLAGDEPRTVLGWLREQALDAISEGTAAVGYAGDWKQSPHGDGVPVFVDEDRDAIWRLPEEDLPAWVDVEADLPVRGPTSQNPFILADFSGADT